MTMHRHDNQVTLDASLASVAACQGRLTLESGVPISTTDQLAKTTVYFTPYNGNRISLYSGSVWNERVFAETSLDISAFTASKNYDIFGYDNSGTLALEGLVWTNDTTRATALALQDGIEVKSGAATRRYLGTIRTTATAGQTEDSENKRLVSNVYNEVQLNVQSYNTNTSWNINDQAVREYNGGSGQVRAEFVLARPQAIFVAMNGYASAIADQNGVPFSIGIDTTTPADAKGNQVYMEGQPNIGMVRPYVMIGPALASALLVPGYHYVTQCERSTSTATNYPNGGMYSHAHMTVKG